MAVSKLHLCGYFQRFLRRHGLHRGKGGQGGHGSQRRPHGAFWPKAAIGDKVYCMSAMAAALTAYNDANNADVPYESPSNKDLRITGTVLEDGTEVLLDQQQASDVLNANGVIHRDQR